MKSEHKIILVFDPNFGERLVELAQRHYVWIVRSPENEIGMRKYAKIAKWAEGEDPLQSGVTVFGDAELDGEFMDSIWDHHGEHSHNPPLSEIVVIGRRPTRTTLDALSAYGFEVSHEDNRGFIASRGPERGDGREKGSVP